jgi:hypothetical protein
MSKYGTRLQLTLSRCRGPTHSGHVALDCTFFERGHASSYYLQWSDQDIQTLKVATLTDTESLAVRDVQCSVEWKHDTKIGPQVVRRNERDNFCKYLGIDPHSNLLLTG